MKFSLCLCGSLIILLLGILPAAASLSGTDIPIHSSYITEDDSGRLNYTYSDDFAIDHDQMVWEKFIRGQANSSNFSITIYLMNITDGTTRIVATSPSQEFQYFFQTPFGFADGRMVWNAQYDSNLFMYDDRTEKVSPLTSDGTADVSIQRRNRDPFVFGDRVVWTKQKLYPSEDSDIVLYNLTDRTLRDIVTDPGKKAMPAMDDSYIVWVDKRSEPGAGDIYLFDLTNNTERPLCTARGLQHYPQVSGNYVVWADLRDGPPAIYLYNLTTGTEYRISDSNYYAAIPYLSGNYVTWEMYALYDDTKEKTRQVVVYNIATGESVLFEPGTRHPMLLGLNNNRILYANPDRQTIKDGYVHIFAIETPAPVQSIPEVPVVTTPHTENRTAPASYSFSEPAPAGSGPAAALAALLPGIGLVMAIRKYRTGRKNR
jgi:beta propeller repeat protein